MSRVLVALALVGVASPARAAPPPSAETENSSDAKPGAKEKARAAAEADAREVDETHRTIVVTTASRTRQNLGDTAVATRVVDRQAVEDSGAENLQELLEEQPGVQVTRNFGGAGGAGIRLQGLDPRYTLVLIDGQRINGRISGVIDLTRIQAEDIEQVEIVNGPGSSLYGSDAMAGVVNVITRRSRKPYEAEVHSAYGSFNTFDLSARAGLRRARGGVALSGGWHRRDGFTLPNPDRAPEDESTTGNSQNNQNIALAADYAPPGPHDVHLSTRVDFQQLDIRGVDFSPPRANFDRRNLTRIVGATLTPEVRWSAPARLRLIARYNYFNDLLTQDQRRSDELDKRERTIDQLGEITAQYDHLVAGRHMATAGFTGSFESIVSPRVTGDLRDRQRVGLYVQDEWTVARAPRVALVPSARLDHDTQFGSAVTPKIAARVDPREWMVLRVSYGLGFRAPDFKELYLLFANPAVGYRVEGNPDLQPERSRGFNGGMQLLAKEWGTLSVSYFQNRIDNLITTPTTTSSLDPDGTIVFRYVNIDAASTRGAETLATIRFPKFFLVDGSYTFTDAQDLSEELPGGRPRPLPGRSRHQGAFRVVFHHKKWGTRAQLRGAAFGEQPFYIGDETQILDPYLRLDLRVSQTFLKYFSVFAGVDNLAGAGDPTLLPIVPRSFYGGLTIRWWAEPRTSRP